MFFRISISMTSMANLWHMLGRMPPSRVALILQANILGTLGLSWIVLSLRRTVKISLAALRRSTRYHSPHFFHQQQEQQEELVSIGSYNNSKHLTQLSQLYKFLISNYVYIQAATCSPVELSLVSTQSKKAERNTETPGCFDLWHRGSYQRKASFGQEGF